LNWYSYLDMRYLCAPSSDYGLAEARQSIVASRARGASSPGKSSVGSRGDRAHRAPDVHGVSMMHSDHGVALTILPPSNEAASHDS